jgi:hypothetical protein
MFIFKKKKLSLDCFISNNHIAELFPICYTIKKMPEWWRSIPKTTEIQNFPVEMSTIKRCPGFKDLFANSICMPAWSEYRLYQDPSYGFSHTAPNSAAMGNQHQEGQLEGAFPNYQHYKLISPWLLKENSGTYFSMVQASWHMEDPCGFHIPAGCLEFKHQHSTHINLVSPKKEKLCEHTIDAGSPLVYLIPITDKEITLNIQIVSENEINKLKTYHHSFYNSYEITKKIQKKNE